MTIFKTTKTYIIKTNSPAGAGSYNFNATKTLYESSPARDTNVLIIVMLKWWWLIYMLKTTTNTFISHYTINPDTHNKKTINPDTHNKKTLLDQASLITNQKKFSSFPYLISKPLF